jgi:thioredoxin:protein disulfide reductase
MDRKWIPRLVLGVCAGALVPILPALLSTPTGSADLSSRLGLAGGVGPATFAVLYLAGLLTSLTPCVYPLIPITVGVFGARKSERRGRAAALSATYVLGIATTYSSLGLFAALSGHAFGSALASPWVAAAMALFMLALAASMFGAFELDLPFALKQRLTSVKGTGFGPAFAMGLVAGVIAAPCTGPVLAGVLAYVTSTRSAALGFWMLFTYAVGLGTLFFVIGTTSMKLPRSGAWMETVKTVFGVALVTAGVGLLLPLLPRPAALPLGNTPVAAITGAAAFVAVLAGALTLSFHAEGREKLQKAAALGVLVLAIGLRFGWLGAARSEHRPIAWLHDEQTALAEALRTGKPVLVDFFAEWCAACKELDMHTFSDPQVQAEVAAGFVPLKVDATDETDEVTRLTSKYGVPGLPTVLMFGCRDHAAAPAAPLLAPASPAARASAPVAQASPPVPANPAAASPPLPPPAAQASCSQPAEGSAGRLTGYEPPDKLLERMKRVQCVGERC